MKKILKASLWLNRFVLLFVSLLFAFIAFKSILHPLETTAASGIILNSATAFSVVRVSMGAFPLGFAIIAFTSIFWNKYLFGGILSVFILVSITTIVRIISLQIDGPSDFGQKVLVPEIAITLLSAIGVYFEWQRTKSKGTSITTII